MRPTQGRNLFLTRLAFEPVADLVHGLGQLWAVGWRDPFDDVVWHERFALARYQLRWALARGDPRHDLFVREVTTSTDVEPPPVAGAFALWANRAHISLNGDSVVSATVAVVFASTLVLVSFSAPEEGFSWDEVSQVSASQAARVTKPSS